MTNSSKQRTRGNAEQIAQFIIEGNSKRLAAVRRNNGGFSAQTARTWVERNFGAYDGDVNWSIVAERFNQATQAPIRKLNFPTPPYESFGRFLAPTAPTITRGFAS
jgi:hypothetical protein